MKPNRRKLRLSLMGRLLLCFAFGGVGINLSLWYGLTNSPPTGLIQDMARNGQTEGPSGEGPPDGGPPQGMNRPPSGPPGGRPPAAMQGPPHHGPIMMNEASEIIDRLEDTPNLDFARKLSRDKHINIRLETLDGGWSTGDSLPRWIDIAPTTRPSPQNSEFRMGSRLVSRAIGPRRWIIFFPQDWSPGLFSDPRFRFLLAGQVSIVIAICFIFAFWQLRPLRSLEKGAREVAKGNLNHQVPIEQESELGDLARTFNQMTAQLKALVESKDELLAGISHELRSPLTRMKLALHVEGEKSLPRIHRNIEQMEKLISELLESSRLDSGKTELRPERFLLSDLLQEITESYAGQSPAIQIETTAGNLEVLGDRDRLGRVLVNLVENAFKYSSSSGRPILLKGIEVPNGVELRVRDHGPGVPEAMLDQIFEPFFRIDKSRSQKTGGYGLGLSLCRKIAAAHGGSIHARNVPQGGLEIVVFLPHPQILYMAA